MVFSSRRLKLDSGVLSRELKAMDEGLEGAKRQKQDETRLSGPRWTVVRTPCS